MPNTSSQNTCGLDPDIICSSVNKTLHKINPRLASWFAVKQMIAKIRRRKVVHKLSASSLGEVPCIRLLDFLTSDASFHGLTELYLPQNGISSNGLLSVACFLRDNTTLRELSLYGNPLTADPDVVAVFASALNSSRLRTLLILDENCPGDPFLRLFLPKLAAPYLQHLRLATKCTQDTIPILEEYLNSPQCRLHRLDCKVSKVSIEGFVHLLCTVGRNMCLQYLELSLDIEDHTPSGYLKCSRTFHIDVRQNRILHERVKDEALALLRYSRALFLHSRKGQPRSSSSRFFDLPVELVQEITAHLAPLLSLQQRIRVTSYAADINTLFPPGHRDRVQSGGGLTERLKILAQAIPGITPPAKKERFGGKSPTCQCTSGLEGSCPRQRRWRMDTRALWLTEVGCDSFDRPSWFNPGVPVLHFETP